MNCPFCNSIIPDDSKYCSNCGKSLFKKCYNCSKEIRITNQYCQYCGFDNSDANIKSHEVQKLENEKQHTLQKKRSLKKTFLIMFFLVIILVFVIFTINQIKIANTKEKFTNQVWANRLSVSLFTKDPNGDYLLRTEPFYLCATIKNDICYLSLYSERFGFIYDKNIMEMFYVRTKSDSDNKKIQVISTSDLIEYFKEYNCSVITRKGTVKLNQTKESNIINYGDLEIHNNYDSVSIERENITIDTEKFFDLYEYNSSMFSIGAEYVMEDDITYYHTNYFDLFLGKDADLVYPYNAIFLF